MQKKIHSFQLNRVKMSSLSLYLIPKLTYFIVYSKGSLAVLHNTPGNHQEFIKPIGTRHSSDYNLSWGHLILINSFSVTPLHGCITPTTSFRYINTIWHVFAKLLATRPITIH